MTTSQRKKRTPTVTPLARHVWGEVWRIAAASITGVIFFVVNFGLSVDSGADEESLRFTGLVLLDAAVGLVAIALIVLRRRAPFSTATLLACSAAFSSLAVPAALLALMSLASRRQPHQIAIVVAVWIGTGSGAWLLGLDLVGPPTSPLELLVAVAAVLMVLSLVVAIGASIGSRRALFASLRERARLVEEEQRLRENAARNLERARIAREMHDSLAHRLSLTAMHASALRYRTDLDAEEHDETVKTVHENARVALSELRDILAVVRAPEGDDADRPQPSLDDLGHLVAEGTAIDVHIDVDTATLHPTVSRHAYRIVQECLTNARRHAPGLPVSLYVGGVQGQNLEITVVNALPAEPTTVDHGFGLIGIQERARSVAGSVNIIVESGEFRIAVSLPWSTN